MDREKRVAVSNVYTASELLARLEGLADHVRGLQRQAMQEALDVGIRKADLATASGLTSGRMTQITRGKTVQNALEGAVDLEGVLGELLEELGWVPAVEGFEGVMVEPPYAAPRRKRVPRIHQASLLEELESVAS